MVGDELGITNVGFEILSTDTCPLIESEKVVGLHYRALMRFKDELNRVLKIEYM